MELIFHGKQTQSPGIPSLNPGFWDGERERGREGEREETRRNKRMGEGEREGEREERRRNKRMGEGEREGGGGREGGEREEREEEGERERGRGRGEKERKEDGRGKGRGHGGHDVVRKHVWEAWRRDSARAG